MREHIAGSKYAYIWIIPFDTRITILPVFLSIQQPKFEGFPLADWVGLIRNQTLSPET